MNTVLVLVQQSDQRTNPGDSELYCSLKNYLNLPLVPLTTDAIGYWNSNLLDDKILTETGLKYLFIVGSSEPCERLFSQAGNIMTPKRNNLSGKKLAQLLF